MEVCPGRKIGEGRYREVFQVDNHCCVKVSKPVIIRKVGSFGFSIPCGAVRLLKGDINEQEISNYELLSQKLAPGVLKFFNRPLLQCTYDGKPALLVDLVKDDDGNVSLSLEKKGEMEDKSFWTDLDEIEKEIVSLGIPYFGIQGNNLLVRKVNSHYEPVFVDLKRIGAREFPLQPWLGHRYFAKRKITRSFEKLRQTYKIE